MWTSHKLCIWILSCLCSVCVVNILLKLCIWIFSRENYQLWINYRIMIGYVLLSGLILAWTMLDWIVFRRVLWWLLSLLHPQTPVEDVHVKLPVTFPGLIACMVDFDGIRLQHIKVNSIDHMFKLCLCEGTVRTMRVLLLVLKHLVWVACWCTN